MINYNNFNIKLKLSSNFKIDKIFNLNELFIIFNNLIFFIKKKHVLNLKKVIYLKIKSLKKKAIKNETISNTNLFHHCIIIINNKS